MGTHCMILRFKSSTSGGRNYLSFGDGNQVN